jgi:F0F1-type ATP synthase membrane subunit b/b'
MAEYTITAAEARDAALSSQATAQSTEEAPVTAENIAQGLVDSHADRIRRDKMISWFKSQGVDGMQTIYDANQ